MREQNPLQPPFAEGDVSSLDDLEPTFAPQPVEIAECIDDVHPVMAGRVRCRFERPYGATEVWLPCLVTVRPRVGDRVLVQRVEGVATGLVTGVVDGFRLRAEPDPRAAHIRRLQPDEVIRIEADDGTPLLEMAVGDAGPVVRLLRSDIELAAPGALKITADSVELRARQGEIQLAASEDVVVTGEQIRLN